MKKTIFLTAILIAALGFTGCGGSEKNGGDLNINATVKFGDTLNDEVDEVRAVGFVYVSDGNWENVIIANAPYKNGGFEITLPKKIDERLLAPMDFEGLFPIDVTASNKKVKSTSIDKLYAFKNNTLVGRFENTYNGSDVDASSMYIFVDGNCKISGYDSYTDSSSGTPYTCEITIDLNLKKGWNTVYATFATISGDAIIYTLKTQKPAFDLIWYFENGSVYFAPQKSLKPFN